MFSKVEVLRIIFVKFDISIRYDILNLTCKAQSIVHLKTQAVHLSRLFWFYTQRQNKLRICLLREGLGDEGEIVGRFFRFC